MKSAISPLKTRYELVDIIVELNGAGVLPVSRDEGLLVGTLFDDESDSAVGLVVSDKGELVLVGGINCEVTVEEGLVAEVGVAEPLGPSVGRGNSDVCDGGLAVVSQPKYPEPTNTLSGQILRPEDRVG